MIWEGQEEEERGRENKKDKTCRQMQEEHTQKRWEERERELK